MRFAKDSGVGSGEARSSLPRYHWHGRLGVVSFSFTTNRGFLSHFFSAVLWGDTPGGKTGTAGPYLVNPNHLRYLL